MPTSDYSGARHRPPRRDGPHGSVRVRRRWLLRSRPDGAPPTKTRSGADAAEGPTVVIEAVADGVQVHVIGNQPLPPAMVSRLRQSLAEAMAASLQLRGGEW